MAKFWTLQELSDVLTKSSPHVRYLLWELFVKDEVPKENLESKPVALAIVQRLCRSKGKDSLVITDNNGNGAVYKLNPDYLEDFQNLLAKDEAPEKPKPRPKENKTPKKPLVSTRSMGREATELEVEPVQPHSKTRRSLKTKKAGQVEVDHENELVLPLTKETDFKFWFDFIKKINTRFGIQLTIMSNGESAILRIP